MSRWRNVNRLFMIAYKLSDGTRNLVDQHKEQNERKWALFWGFAEFSSTQ